jgi:hypothetical protein
VGVGDLIKDHEPRIHRQQFASFRLGNIDGVGVTTWSSVLIKEGDVVVCGEEA